MEFNGKQSLMGYPLVLKIDMPLDQSHFYNLEVSWEIYITDFMWGKSWCDWEHDRIIPPGKVT
jgi:hypothetical protein